MSTEKLYYQDAYTRQFTATVRSCEAAGERFEVLLDRTAFFPEEGGQSADTGTLNDIPVLDVKESGGEIRHFLSAPLEPGRVVIGHLDWPERFRKMQSHTAEHVLSGLIYRRFGYENTGFHLAEDEFIMDCSGELSAEDLVWLEQAANEAVWENHPVSTFFPAPEELAKLFYRSKLDLTEGVRIVHIEDIDDCACCAPHLSGTGQIGLVRLCEAMRHRGGMRIRAKAGSDALRDYQRRAAADRRISELLSVPQTDIAEGVEKLLSDRDTLKLRLAEAQQAALQGIMDRFELTDGNLLLFADADMEGLRTLVNRGVAFAGGLCGAFTGTDGDYRFVLGSRHLDTRAWFNEHREALKARGGGKPEMISGTCAASRTEIEALLQ